MAITITAAPPTDSCLNDDIWVTCSSTNSGTTNFKFVFDIKVGGSLLSRSKVFPNPADSKGYFNTAPIIRSQITDYFEPSGSSILVASNNKNGVTYVLEVREEVSGGISVLPDASATYRGTNFYYPEFTDLYSSGSNVNLSSVYNTQLTNYKDNWLTERDLQNISVKFGDRFYISYLRSEGINETGYLRTLDSAGNVVASYNAAVNMSGGFNLFNLSAAALNTWRGSTIITENTYAYEFYITGAGTSRVVRIQHYCNWHQGYNVHFLNRLGGYDTYNFSLVNRKSTTYERNDFKRSDWQRTSGIMQTYDAYNRYNQTRVPFSVKHTNNIKLTGDWVNAINYDWLQQLVASPTAYLEVQSMYLPLYITTSNWEQKIMEVDKMFNLEIDAEIPKTIYSQFR